MIDALARKADREASKASEVLGIGWTPKTVPDPGAVGIAAISDDRSSDNLAAFKALSEHLGLTEGFYSAWLSETWLAHAGVRLAEAYAKVTPSELIASAPVPAEMDLAIVGVLTWYCVALAAEVIERDGHVQVANELSRIVGSRYELW